MPKAKPEPARPYYTVKHEFTEAQKRFNLAADMLYNSITILREHMNGLPAPALDQLDREIAEFRAAAYGDE
jgi:hypothetical protein